MADVLIFIPFIWLAQSLVRETGTVIEKLNVVYTRYSSDQQRHESCEDQERDTRSGLARKEIDRVDLVLYDEAESGTKVDRTKFQELVDLIAAGKIGILAVDDQSRLTRAENALAFIKDLVFSGGRFISTSENIDTEEPGWELKVKVLELHHSETIRGLRDKVRRGQRGRVLADDSAGDFPYGYESYYHDADWQEQLARRGPKPKKGIRINDILAMWVRRIFQLFITGMSICAIARLLTKEGAPKGCRATTPGWHPQQVHRILTNAKYIGQWRWGATTTIRNSRGRTKQVSVSAEEIVVRDRPDLRIVEQDVWDRAQRRLKALKDKFGLQPGQAKRGPKAPVNPAVQYPRSLLGGLLRCAACDGPMWVQGSGSRRYYACAGRMKNRCDQSFQVPLEAADESIIEAITRRVRQWPDWLRQLQVRLTTILSQAAERVPQEQIEKEGRLKELTRQHDNLINAVAQGGVESTGILARIAKLETQIGETEGLLATMRLPTAKELELPSEQWVRDQIDDWASSLSDLSTAGRAIRDALARIDARPIIAPGKKRGYPELTLHFRSWELFRAMIAGQLPDSVQVLMPDSLGIADAPTETIALGGPTEMDRWAPEIVRWRKENVPWKEIVRVRSAKSRSDERRVSTVGVISSGRGADWRVGRRASSAGRSACRGARSRGSRRTAGLWR